MLERGFVFIMGCVRAGRVDVRKCSMRWGVNLRVGSFEEALKSGFSDAFWHGGPALIVRLCVASLQVLGRVCSWLGSSRFD